jgi:type I restriction enzyme, S subunit
VSYPALTVGQLVLEGAADIQTGPFGTQLKASDYSREGIPVINVRNVGYGDLRADKIEFVPEATAERLSVHVLSESDIVFGRKGAVDRHLFVTNEQAGWVQGSDCIRLRLNQKKINPRFVSYAFLRSYHREWMLQQCGNKATMASLNQDVIRRIVLPFPRRDQQDEIVSSLSAYDYLIENNRRRIALLGEATRMLYHEWFVRFRFPGHEHVKIADGIPEGWDKQTLSTLCSPGDGIQTGPFGSQLHQHDYSEAGVPVVMPKDLIEFRISAASIARIPEELADKLRRHRMRGGDTVYGRRGDIGRRAYIGSRQEGWFCGTGCLRIRPDASKISPRFLFESLGSQATAGFIANQAKGSTMPNLSAGALKSVPILCPPMQFQTLFVEAIEPTAELVETLVEQNQKLAHARDLLLPRLMNGEILV